MSDLDATRAQLRRYLLPQTLNTIEDDGDHFPRSKVMRFALNPRNRRVLAISGSVLGVLATRMVGSHRAGIVAEVIRSIGRRK
jgi:hypothetical protein